MPDTGRSGRAVLLVGLGCFVAGAVFWHLVGFWSFVAQIAFNQDETKSPTRLINLDEVRAVKAAKALSPARLTPPAGADVAAVAQTSSAAEHGRGDALSDLLQCSEARRGAAASGEGDRPGETAGAKGERPVVRDMDQAGGRAMERNAGSAAAMVTACPPLIRRLPSGNAVAARGDRQIDARESAERLLRGWNTGVSRIETGSVR